MLRREVLFPGSEGKETLKKMPKNAFIFIGPPTSGKTTHTLFLSETIMGKVLRGRDVIPSLTLESSRELIDDEVFIPALEVYLRKEVVPSVVLDNVPRTRAQAETVLKWAKNNQVGLNVVQLNLSESEVVQRSAKRMVCNNCGESYHPDLKPPKTPEKCDKDGSELAARAGDKPDLLRKVYAGHIAMVQEVTGVLKESAGVQQISASGTVYETAERVFRSLSPVIFYKEQMAGGYYRLRRVLGQAGSRSLFISGMPTFIYGGRALMKDFDILVPDNKIDNLGQMLTMEVGEKHSSVADTRFVDVSGGVEIDSDLIVKYEGGSVRFDFDFLWEEARIIRFMGLDCAIMGLEDLVLLKAALGRQGADDYGKFKSDMSDMEGLLGAQNVDYNKMRKRADKLGMRDRLEEKLKILGVNI